MKVLWIILLILDLGLTFPHNGQFSGLSSFLTGIFSSGEIQNQSMFSSSEEAQEGEEVYLTSEGDLVIDIPEDIEYGGF